MSSFDKIIGYESIKIEIARICDVVKNGDKYRNLGVTLPNGLLLYGEPGVGKTLFARSFIDESERKSFICRKNLPDGEFIKFLKETFEEAKNNTPSIILLDDFDKFANEDKDHKNAEEYVTIQSCIDEIKKYDVFVIATANDLSLVPSSLLRAGRFDTTIEIKNPKGEDAEQIIKHYLSLKNSVADMDFKQLARILNGRSCAELETIINQAGIYAGFQNKEKIGFDDIVRASIRIVYDAPETIKNGSVEDNEMVAYHEAGHAVISELLEPNSVTMISIGNHESSIGGFTAYYRDNQYWHSVDLMKNRIMCLLGGRCAIELKYGKTDAGCVSDIERAIDVVQRIITQYCGLGFDKCNSRHFDFELSGTQKFYQERTINDELERYYQQVKELLVNNRKFLDELAQEINKKKLLTAQDIKEIKENL